MLELKNVPYEKTGEVVQDLLACGPTLAESIDNVELHITFARWFREFINTECSEFVDVPNSVDKGTQRVTTRDLELHHSVWTLLRMGLLGLTPKPAVGLVNVIYAYAAAARPINPKTIDALLERMLKLPEGWQFSHFSLLADCIKRLRPVIALDNTPDSWNSLSDKERQARLFLGAACICARDSESVRSQEYLKDAVNLAQSAGNIEYKKLDNLPKPETYCELYTKQVPMIWEILGVPYPPGNPPIQPSAFRQPSRYSWNCEGDWTLPKLYDDLAQELGEDFTPPTDRLTDEEYENLPTARARH